MQARFINSAVCKLFPKNFNYDLKLNEIQNGHTVLEESGSLRKSRLRESPGFGGEALATVPTWSVGGLCENPVARAQCTCLVVAVPRRPEDGEDGCAV